nr:hypothetical transcript [Hymenolepis microstoma]
MYAFNLCKTAPQMEMVVSETESEVSGSFSGFSALSEDKPLKENHYESKTDRSYDERELRRKERNNAASRKSRALRKHRFQQMIKETERLTNSNARLRAFVDELNSIMVESRAILFKTFAGSVNTDVASITHQQTNRQIQQQQHIGHLRE